MKYRLAAPVRACPCRAPQGARGLKFDSLRDDVLSGKVAPRKGRVG